MAGEIEGVTQTAVVYGGGGLTVIGLVTWFLKTLREQKSAAREDRTAEVIEAGTAAIVGQLTSEVMRLTGEVKVLVEKNDSLTAMERKTAIENAELNSKVGGLLYELRDLRDDLSAANRRIEGLEAKLNRPRPEMGVPSRRAEDAP